MFANFLALSSYSPCIFIDTVLQYYLWLHTIFTPPAGDDYVSTTHNFLLTSGSGVGSLVNVSIPIVDDNIAESVIEFFWANIALLASQQIVVVSTNRTAVLIQDNDRKELCISD